MNSANTHKDVFRSLHILGVLYGLAAGAWLGSAEAPTKFVTQGISPFVISAMMVFGVFIARWTIPTFFKGTSYIWLDLKTKPYLIIWAIIAGSLWAVANTLTIFAIRDVGLAVAFPIWNSNCLVGLFWGWLLFKELRGANKTHLIKVIGGAIVIVIATTILAFASTKQVGIFGGGDKTHGIIAALTAGLLWGTMYIPYRKAYISGMNPLSFVTVFTIGEVLMIITLSVVFMHGFGNFITSMHAALPYAFWLFLGGFFWVVGDIFQQFAAKYIGIGRGIPLANTNQLWGLAWAALVLGDLSLQSTGVITTIVGGSVLMILGAVAISFAQASPNEQIHWKKAAERECTLYNLNRNRVHLSALGKDSRIFASLKHRWWDYLIIAAATSIFIILAFYNEHSSLAIDVFWLMIIMIAVVAITAVLFYKQIYFSLKNNRLHKRSAYEKN